MDGAGDFVALERQASDWDSLRWMKLHRSSMTPDSTINALIATRVAKCIA